MPHTGSPQGRARQCIIRVIRECPDDIAVVFHVQEFGISRLGNVEDIQISARVGVDIQETLIAPVHDILPGTGRGICRCLLLTSQPRDKHSDLCVIQTVIECRHETIATESD